MAVVYEIPDPVAVEDSAVRFGTPAEENSRGLFRRFVRATYTLLDGPNAGSDVAYVIPEVALAAGGTVDTGGLTDAELRATPVPVTLPAAPATGTSSNVANSASSVTVLAANANRRGATIFNDDTIGTGATLRLKLGATASATSFTVAVPPQGYYEVPFGYTGIIDGIASVATGTARVTELT